MTRANGDLESGGAFGRLGEVARRDGAAARMARLSDRWRAKRAQGARLGSEEHLELALAAYDAEAIPLEAAVFFVFRLLVDGGPGQERVQEVYERDFHERREAILGKYGVAEGEDWPMGQDPPEARQLDAEFDQACRRVGGDVLRKYARAWGHPVLEEASRLYESDPAAFDRCVEEGRRQIPGPRGETADGPLDAPGLKG